MFLLKYGRKEITKKKQTETPTKDSNLIFFYYAQSTGMVLSGRTPKNPKTQKQKLKRTTVYFYFFICHLKKVLALKICIALWCLTETDSFPTFCVFKHIHQQTDMKTGTAFEEVVV